MKSLIRTFRWGDDMTANSHQHHPEMRIVLNYSHWRVTGKYEVRPAAKKLYQLRPTVTASSVSVASRVFNPKHISCVPRLVRNCISCIES
jgi:hypothetical protein